MVVEEVTPATAHTPPVEMRSGPPESPEQMLLAVVL
jgi:hypothetical protein